jgi:hypothetical protein
VYQEAARRIAEDEETFSCRAICAALRSTGLGYVMQCALPEVQAYFKVFAPKCRVWEDVAVALQRRIEEDWHDQRDLRVLLLCMMAACCDDFYDAEEA